MAWYCELAPNSPNFPQDFLGNTSDGFTVGKYAHTYSRYLFWEKPDLNVVVSIEVFSKILDFLSDKPVSTYQIVYGVKCDVKTVRKYIKIIELVQSSGKIKREIKNARVFFTKER